MLFIETPIFTKEVRALLRDDEYRALQSAILLRPDARRCNPWRRGSSKTSMGHTGEGQTWRYPCDLLLGQKAGNDLHDASATPCAQPPDPGGAQIKKQDFDKLVESVKQAGKILRGEMKPSRTFKFRSADIKAIRVRLGKSQSEFALMIGVSIATLQNWEHGRRYPEGPARALLKVAAENPEAVAEALGSVSISKTG